MIIEELRGELELKNALATAFRARWHLCELVLVTNPEWMLHTSLLLRVAKDLTGLPGGDNVEKLILSACCILCVFFDEFFESFSLYIVIVIKPSLIVVLINLPTLLGSLLPRSLLVVVEELVDHLIVGSLTLAETQSNEGHVKLFGHLESSWSVSLLLTQRKAARLSDIKERVSHGLLARVDQIFSKARFKCHRAKLCCRTFCCGSTCTRVHDSVLLPFIFIITGVIFTICFGVVIQSSQATRSQNGISAIDHKFVVFIVGKSHVWVPIMNNAAISLDTVRTLDALRTDTGKEIEHAMIVRQIWNVGIDLCDKAQRRVASLAD